VRIVERRIVTVLFADLVGFTALSERLDAEDVSLVQDDGLLEVGDWEEARAVVGELRASPDERSQAYAEMFEGELELVSVRGPSYSFASLEEALASSLEVFERLGDEKVSPT